MLFMSRYSVLHPLLDQVSLLLCRCDLDAIAFANDENVMYLRDGECGLALACKVIRISYVIRSDGVRACRRGVNVTKQVAWVPLPGSVHFVGLKVPGKLLVNF